MSVLHRLRVTSLIFLVLSSLLYALEAPSSFGQAGRDPQKGASPIQRASDRATPNDQPSDFAEVILADVANEVKSRLESIRGLKFKEEVKKEIKTRAEVREYIVKTMREEMPAEKLRGYQKVLAKLGLIPPSLDVEKLIIDLLSEQVAAFYDDDAKRLYMTTDSFSFMFKIYLLHEMTHALQDQHFHLDTLPVDKENDDDLAMAVKAVVEGEATLTMLEYAGGRNARKKDVLANLDLWNDPEFWDGADESLLGVAGGEVFSKAPDFFKRVLVFPYAAGAAFVSAVRQKRGWGGVSRIYDDLPSSSEQILHPEKYTSERDDPVEIEISLGELCKALGEDWRPIDHNVLGEFTLAVLAAQFDRKTAEESAAGWDGDRLYAFENAKSGNVLLVLFSAWDSVRDAAEFFDAYREIIVRKYESETLLKATLDTQALRVGEVPDPQSKNSMPNSCLWKTEEDFVYIERRADDVLVLEGIPVGKLEVLKTVAWKAKKSSKQAVRKSNLKKDAK